MAEVRGQLLDEGGAVYNVKAYKTTVNSWVDAIRAAITAAQPVRGTVLFPPGTYDVGESIKVPSGITLAGSGMYSSIVRHTLDPKASYNNNVDAMFDLSPVAPATETKNVRIVDLGMEGKNTTRILAPDGVAIPRHVFMNTQVHHVTVERCRFDASYGAGIAGFDPKHVIVRECSASGNGENGINVNGFHHQIVRNRGENNGSAFIEAAVGFTLVSQNYARGNSNKGIVVGGFMDAGAHGRGWYNVVTDNICIQNQGGLALAGNTCFSLVANNICHANQLWGILVTTHAGVTQHNVVHNNICTANGDPGATNFYGIYIDAPETRVTNNKTFDTLTPVADVNPLTEAQVAAGTTARQKFGMLVYSGANHDVVDNDSRGHSSVDYSFEGGSPPTNIVFQRLRSESTLYVGPGVTFKT